MNRIFTDASFQNITAIANRYGVSSDAVRILAEALLFTNGSMAQFNIAELGGGGQWMQGGMTMVGDMFNNQLKNTVDGICYELSNLISQGALQYAPLPKTTTQNNYQSNQGDWWGDLGSPNSTGSQNGTSYAIFSNINRLAILENGSVTIFDTLNNQIGGVSQQQGGNYSVTFSSQFGTVNLDTLPVISGSNKTVNQVNEVIEQEPQPQFVPEAPVANLDAIESEDDIFNKIEKLALLKNKDIITEEEFESKKTELLGRL